MGQLIIKFVRAGTLHDASSNHSSRVEDKRKFRPSKKTVKHIPLSKAPAVVHSAKKTKAY